jgi:hypothetical protein
MQISICTSFNLSINSSFSLWWTQIIQKWKRKMFSAHYHSSIRNRVFVHAVINYMHELFTHANADMDAVNKTMLYRLCFYCISFRFFSSPHFTVHIHMPLESKVIFFLLLLIFDSFISQTLIIYFLFLFLFFNVLNL